MISTEPETIEVWILETFMVLYSVYSDSMALAKLDFYDKFMRRSFIMRCSFITIF